MNSSATRNLVEHKILDPNHYNKMSHSKSVNLVYTREQLGGSIRFVLKYEETASFHLPRSTILSMNRVYTKFLVNGKCQPKPFVPRPHYSITKINCFVNFVIFLFYHRIDQTRMETGRPNCSPPF